MAKKVRQERLSRGASPVFGRRRLSCVFRLFRKQRLFPQCLRSARYPSDKLKAARLFGTVAEDGLSRSETGRDVKFRLEDQENKATTLWVEYTGAIPDTFKAGAEVIVEGGLRPDGSFQAKTLMTKCPSKYQKENRG
mgnify:CR=1 FL=1